MVTYRIKNTDKMLKKIRTHFVVHIRYTAFLRFETPTPLTFCYYGSATVKAEATRQDYNVHTLTQTLISVTSCHYYTEQVYDSTLRTFKEHGKELLLPEETSV